jgi:hypothetical protein
MTLISITGLSHRDPVIPIWFVECNVSGKRKVVDLVVGRLEDRTVILASYDSTNDDKALA